MRYSVSRCINTYSSKGNLLEQDCTPIGEPFNTREEANKFYDTVDLPAADIAHQTQEVISKEIIEIENDAE